MILVSCLLFAYDYLHVLLAVEVFLFNFTTCVYSNLSARNVAPGFGIGALEELDAEDEDVYASGCYPTYLVFPLYRVKCYAFLLIYCSGQYISIRQQRLALIYYYLYFPDHEL